MLITLVEEDYNWNLFGSARNVLVVDVPLFTTDQYLSYKDLLATSGGHLTFYVDNDNWLSVAYVIKCLLQQGISLTTDPYPPSPKSLSSPKSHRSSSTVLRSNSSKYVADDSIFLPKLDSLALAEHNSTFSEKGDQLQNCDIIFILCYLVLYFHNIL